MLYRGIGASPGIAIGPAYLLDQDKFTIVRRHLEVSEVGMEQERFREAVSKVEDQLNVLISEIPVEIREHASILKAHVLMLRDKMIYDRTLDTIEEDRVNAEWALKKVHDHVKGLFKTVKDDYIRERLEDVEYVIKRVQSSLTGSPSPALTEITSPVILVARDLSPADTVQMSPDRILAFVTDMGSRTSHTAIVAQSLGIPAVVGLENCTGKILTGDTLVVDGLRGEVVVTEDESLLGRYREKQESYNRYRIDVIHSSHLPAETRDGFRVTIKANVELIEELTNVIVNGAEGVGLLRTEFLYLASKGLPSEEKLYRTYREVAERLNPYPVTIRTFDLGGDKFVSSVPLCDEINPALGLRAIRLCLREPSLFKTQLRAILRASVHGRIRILFPLVSGRMEIVQAKQYMKDVMEELQAEGVAFDEKIPLGIMIEVPTAVMVADILAREVDFFSIGTNDLIQYSLAIDRVNERVAHLYEPLHPAILRMIHRTVEAAHDSGIEAALCGEMAGEPMYVPIMLGFGLDELSMNPMVVPRIKRMVRGVTQEECRKLVRELLDIDTAMGIRKRLVTFLSRRFPDEFDRQQGLYGDFTDQDVCLISS